MCRRRRRRRRRRRTDGARVGAAPVRHRRRRASVLFPLAPLSQCRSRPSCHRRFGRAKSGRSNRYRGLATRSLNRIYERPRPGRPENVRASSDGDGVECISRIRVFIVSARTRAAQRDFGVRPVFLTTESDGDRPPSPRQRHVLLKVDSASCCVTKTRQSSNNVYGRFVSRKSHG